MSGATTMLVCVRCGVVFDPNVAAWCDGCIGYPTRAPQDRCKVCPLGHPLHAVRGWKRLARRPATPSEERSGLEYVLRNYNVTLGVPW